MESYLWLKRLSEVQGRLAPNAVGRQALGGLASAPLLYSALLCSASPVLTLLCCQPCKSCCPTSMVRTVWSLQMLEIYLNIKKAVSAHIS